MSKKKILIAVGGTGGHVFPGYNLAKHLDEIGYDVELISDKRGYKFLKNYKDFKISILPSSPIVKKNIMTLFYSFFLIFYSMIKSFIFLVFNRPKILFGMGGYASFPICIAAAVLKIKIIIYENNLIIGKSNRYLLPFTDKVIVSFNELEGIPKKYDKKVLKVGNIIKKDIINFSNLKTENFTVNKINILVLGGSQAAKIFAETLPNIFKKCVDNSMSLKIFQHCLPEQNEMISAFYKESNIEHEVFNFSNDIMGYFSKVNLAITRSGSSVLAELTNANIPFISVPLPSAADNHQYKNALYYENKNFSFLIEEKDLNDKLFPLIKEIHKNILILQKIKRNQRQYSDKNVYDNISKLMKEIFNEKN